MIYEWTKKLFNFYCRHTMRLWYITRQLKFKPGAKNSCNKRWCHMKQFCAELLEETLMLIMYLLVSFRIRLCRELLEEIWMLLTYQVIDWEFNADNTSVVWCCAADASFQSHPIWLEYEDACRAGPGVDHEWSVGTELRQRKMYYDDVSSPQSMAQVLRDDRKRRHFIIDANVQVKLLHYRCILFIVMYVAFTVLYFDWCIILLPSILIRVIIHTDFYVTWILLLKLFYYQPKIIYIYIII